MMKTLFVLFLAILALNGVCTSNSSKAGLMTNDTIPRDSVAIDSTAIDSVPIDSGSVAIDTLSVGSGSAAAPTDEEFDWEPVMQAIIWHESKGNPRAVCGPYVGVMQIAPVMVHECNNILRQRGKSKRYTLNDRYSVEKSKEIFKLIMSKYNPENDIDKACRIWASGIRYNVKRTQPFVDWVHRYIKEHYPNYKHLK